MSDVDRYIAKKENDRPGFKQQVADELFNLRVGSSMQQAQGDLCDNRQQFFKNHLDN